VLQPRHRHRGGSAAKDKYGNAFSAAEQGHNATDGGPCLSDKALNRCGVAPGRQQAIELLVRATSVACACNRRTSKSYLDIVHQALPPGPWTDGETISGHEADFSAPMPREHLSPAHNGASRPICWIEAYVRWIHGALLRVRLSRVLDLACGPVSTPTGWKRSSMIGPTSTSRPQQSLVHRQWRMSPRPTAPTGWLTFRPPTTVALTGW
jgi:hypothetical protein